MNLVIVESPTKAKTIGKFLGPDYKVESSFGHVRDLPKTKLGVDVEHNFAPQYIIPLKSRKTVTALKKLAGKSEGVILATDEDREGEAIAWHLVQALGLNARQIPKIERIVFHEITKSAIEKSLKNPREIDQNLVDAQQARRVLDRLVGYKLSPFLWKKIAGGLSAGRVQSVAVRLIVERENEIRSFKPEEYWTIAALFGEFEAFLTKIDGKPLEKFDIKTKDEAERIADDLRQQNFNVAKIETREVRKNPPTPFITSTLQQEAVKRLGWSSKKTMFVAQRLYEHGRITYMRTDSVNLSEEALTAAKKWLNENLGEKYAAAAPRRFASKSRLAQEAHEAIRPTDVNFKPEDLEDESDKKLYRLIWQRFTASQMPPAEISTVAVEILGGKYTLKATGQQILFDGYLKIWPQKLSEITLPTLKEGDDLELKEVKPEQHFTEPPARYSEASLIKTLEEYGIGRPLTRRLSPPFNCAIMSIRKRESFTPRKSENW
jgi:DNA topoisomerase-1